MRAQNRRMKGVAMFSFSRHSTVISVCISALLLSCLGAEGAPPVRDSERRIARTVKSWRAIQQSNLVMQETDYSCGAAALATLTTYYLGDRRDEEFFLNGLDEILTAEEIEERIENGLTMADLRKVAVHTGYQAAVARMSMEKLFEAKAPLLVGIDVDGYKHFVVYRGFDGYYIYLADPIRGNIRIPASKFQLQWQKNLALAIAKRGVEPNPASALAPTAKEFFLGMTNRQLILSQSARGSIHQTTPKRSLPQIP